MDLAPNLVQAIRSDDHHAFLLSAPSLASLDDLTKQVTIELSKDEQTEFAIVNPDEGSIKIATIRQLYSRTSYRRGGKNRLLVVVKSADTMTLPAQNAFLKLLEEPPRHVSFLLTTTRGSRLLKTVVSRCQVFRVKPDNLADFSRKVKSNDPKQLTKLFYFSRGDSILANQMLVAPTEVDYQALLELRLSDALIAAQATSAEREQALSLSEHFAHLSRAALRHVPGKEHRQWLNRLAAAVRAKELLISGANAKLSIDWLLLEFRS